MLNFIAPCLPFTMYFAMIVPTQVSLPLAATLDSLKTAILRCPALRARAPASSSGPRTIPEMYGLGIKSQMRLFHLGRELKSSGRSLSALGIGRFDNYLVHMASGGVADGKANGGGATSGRKRKAVGASGSGSGSGGGTTVEIDSSDDDDDEVIELDDSQESSAGGKTPAAAASAASSSSGGGGGGPGEVIDLLDDSDDDDAVGGAGGTSGAAAGKRQRA